MLKNLDQFKLPDIENKVLKFWEEKNIFAKSLKKTRNNKKFVFFEGPPTANGRPGIHHILSRAFKDVILRYKTMMGFFVPRKAGWDTHGLPVEIEVEKKLGLRSKKDIEKFGIAAFNKKCKESVWEYKDEWEKMTKRIGFWLDLNNAYITYEKNYIETIWWILKEIWEKKLLYNSYKIVPWCVRCGTALSSHEISLGYKTTIDNSIFFKIRLRPNQNIGKFSVGENVYILSWTTTPWTLPGNVALAVGEKINYVLIKLKDEFYILAKERLSALGWSEIEIVKEFLGKDLVGLSYDPLFEVKPLASENSYKIFSADFVNTSDGTGVVHTAVMYGEDDYELGKKVGLPMLHTVDERGFFKEETGFLKGMYVKDQKTEDAIFDYLKSKNLFLKVEKYEHEYPFCWRCSTPLLYYARNSWFIKMSALKGRLIKVNEEVNWMPESIKYGRFGEWLKDLKDWAISRERYWGAPLPVWVCHSCGKKEIVGSIKELSLKLQPSRNNYILLRHGEALSNKENFLSSYPEVKESPLTLRGVVQAEKAARMLKKEKIDLIFASDILRSKETAEIVGKKLNVEVVFDERLREINFGILNGKQNEEYHKYLPTYFQKFENSPPQGESLNDARRRIFSFIEDLEKTYSNKRILIVGHEYPLWLFYSIAKGFDFKETVKLKESVVGDFLKNGEILKNVKFEKAPRNLDGEIDLHKPYVDEVTFKCFCGGNMERVREVIDVWFDSGAMPFAQNHYPFSKKLDYPADYIAEGIDQTRGWFYTLMAIAVLLSKKAPYKNVISLGLVLDKYGQKMSKSKGNIVNPWEVIEKYGADIVRWYFFTVNSPGEPKRFDESELQNILRQFVLLIYNSFVFYNTYGRRVNKVSKLSNILDEWIYYRLLETKKAVIHFMDEYNIMNAGKVIEEFVNDISKWYIRRSRRRFQKRENDKDYEEASFTLYHILLELSKMLAPFMPFFAEALYKSLFKNKNSSVHLEELKQIPSYLKFKNLKNNKRVINAMSKIRDLAGMVLRKRAEFGIKVRQPLSCLTLSSKAVGGIKYRRGDFLKILMDEVNVKEIKIKDIDEDFILDTEITPELKEEGILREIVRVIQDLRQDAGLIPSKKVSVYINAGENMKRLILRNSEFLKSEINLGNIVLGERVKNKGKIILEAETKIEGETLKVYLQA